MRGIFSKRRWVGGLAIVTLGLASYAQQGQSYRGFDRNEYPGDASLPELRKHFSYAGYWLTNPPGATTNGWTGKRRILLKYGFGFVVLANGREEARIEAARVATHLTPMAQGQVDGRAAVAAAKGERFPAGTIVFLDQEEGGRLTEDQAAYIKGWVAPCRRLR